MTALYDGFRYQLYAQYFALQEMGFSVREMRIYAQKTNRNFPVPVPSEAETAEFERVLERIRAYSPEAPFTPNPKKCAQCIYSPLCDVCPLAD